jgi:hypothetical protein
VVVGEKGESAACVVALIFGPAVEARGKLERHVVLFFRPCRLVLYMA